MEEVCQQCGKKYKEIGQHWVQSNSCSHPKFTTHQREIITGILMGDGCLDRGNKNPYLIVEMISPDYLSHIQQQFSSFGTGVKLLRTAKEGAKKNRNSGFHPNAREENYSDVYRWRSRSHPELHKFAEWYSTGKKVWPANIKLTPTVLKHWYCGDGSWDNSARNNRITIAMNNEVNNINKIEQMFENVGLPSPNNWDINTNSCKAVFSVEQSEELWEYMGKPLPDFEYKWPKRYRNL